VGAWAEAWVEVWGRGWVEVWAGVWAEEGVEGWGGEWEWGRVPWADPLLPRNRGTVRMQQGRFPPSDRRCNR